MAHSRLSDVRRLSSTSLTVLGVAALSLASPASAKPPAPPPGLENKPENPASGGLPPGLAKQLPAEPELFRLGEATIEDIQAAMENGSLTSVELISLYLRRIQAFDKPSTISPNLPLNSVGALNPDLLDDAAEADALRKEGTILGPLHGIPFLVKWSYPIKNMPLTGGINAWRNFVTQNEAWCIIKMREAGGIAMGHANMDSWANSASNSVSQIKGAVRSAYLQGALPGGSSGGSGVSSGAYLTHFAFGGETGGSIRHPSDRNGLVGYKVSGGSVSVDRIIPLAPDRDVIGPMTRSAKDNAIIRDVVGPVDPNDLWTPAHKHLAKVRPVPEEGFVEAIDNATLQGKKIGIIGTYVGIAHPNPGDGATNETRNVQTTTPATFALVEQMKADMEAAGATVNYVFMPPPVSTTYPLPAGSPRLLLDRTAPLFPNTYSYVIRGVIEAVVREPSDTLQDYAPKVLAAAAPVATNFISTAARQLMYSLDPDTGIYSLGGAIGFGSPEGDEHFSARSMHHAAFEAWLDSEGLDVVVWPTFANKTRTGGSTLGRDLANIMNLPSVTVPMGMLPQPATSTLPEGVEPLTLNITGRFFDDQKVLGVAYAYEQATHHRFNPPLAPALPGEEFDLNRQYWMKRVSDKLPPVLSIAPGAAVSEGLAIKFTGQVADKGGVKRLEVSIAGALIPTLVEGTTWTAVLPAESAANAFLAGATSVDVVVLAVDEAGNATCLYEDILL